MFAKKVDVQVYANEYGEGKLTKSFIDKNFGFELVVNSNHSMVREILSYDNVMELRVKIDKALAEYNSVMHKV